MAFQEVNPKSLDKSPDSGGTFNSAFKSCTCFHSTSSCYTLQVNAMPMNNGTAT